MSFVSSPFCLAALIFITSHGAFAQSGGKGSQPSSNSDQELREIVAEIRLLRAEMRRLSVNTHRSQVVLERIKLQQDEIVRVKRDIGEVHDKLDDLRAAVAKSKTMMKSLTRQFEAGLKDDDAVKAYSAIAEEFENRERALEQRESALMAELELAQGGLAELNTRLDAIEREMAEPAGGQDGKPAQRQQ